MSGKTTDAEALPDRAGQRLGGYELRARLGSGGMGEVYRALDTRLEREVALKILPEEFFESEDKRGRFEREARMLASLNHPNIAVLYSFEEIPGSSSSASRHLLVMELVGGRTLREFLMRGTPPLRKSLDLACQIASGLARAHEAGIVHRDLKPENVMVTGDGLVKILDFGLAKRMPFEGDAGSGRSTLTQEGSIVGTAGYMSPEQARGLPVDFRTDQFSFGSILYEMTAGKPAFQRASAVETLAAIINEEPRPVAELSPAAPAPLRWIIERCLAKDPAHRYASTQDLAQDLKIVRDRLTEMSGASATAIVAGVPGRLRLAGWLAAGAVLAGLVGLAVLLWRGEKSASTARPIRSLAVLPLQNLSGDPQQEYFADGMTEELITQLAKISGLRVISRTSVMQYKGAMKPLPEIAKQLNVESIVEGSVTRSGNRVRITAQLIQASTERHLWAESYERELRDVLSLQTEAARAIAKEVRVKLSPQEEERLASSRQVNAEAYELYLRGRSALESLTTPGKETALRLFEQATALDPAFARAHAGIARVYLRGRAGVAPEIALTRAEQATERALSLDESLPEAHLAAASLRKAALDWVGTEREYRRAIELDPNSVDARVEYGVWLSALARHAEALDQVRMSNSLDPLSPRAAWAAATVLRFARRYDEAIAQAKKALALDPNYGPAHQTLGLCYSARGKFDEAIAAFLRSGRTSGNLGHAYALAGRTREARELLADLEARYEQTGAGAMDIAQIYVGLGDHDRAFEWLERDRPPSEHFTFRVAEIWDPLRSDPRFAKVLERWRLTDAQTRPPAPEQKQK